LRAALNQELLRGCPDGTLPPAAELLRAEHGWQLGVLARRAHQGCATNPFRRKPSRRIEFYAWASGWLVEDSEKTTAPAEAPPAPGEQRIENLTPRLLPKG